ncbi:MAG: AMP-binding protein [Ignavibacteriaceae bacterium]|nr:AMP-binding protein [Ignavibacteriaceae bacterium]
MNEIPGFGSMKMLESENVRLSIAWFQTETGSMIVSPFPGASEFKPGYLGCPFSGIEIDIVDLEGSLGKEGEGGYLIVKDSWPSMFTAAKEEKEETNLNCWKQFKGSYFTRDAAIRLKCNFIKIFGRVDDVIESCRKQSRWI